MILFQGHSVQQQNMLIQSSSKVWVVAPWLGHEGAAGEPTAITMISNL